MENAVKFFTLVAILIFLRIDDDESIDEITVVLLSRCECSVRTLDVLKVTKATCAREKMINFPICRLFDLREIN